MTTKVRAVKKGDCFRDAYGDKFEVLSVYGRGRNRRAVLDRAPFAGGERVGVTVGFIRRHWTQVPAEESGS
jgi:hypothetical protein